MKRPIELNTTRTYARIGPDRYELKKRGWKLEISEFSQRDRDFRLASFYRYEELRSQILFIETPKGWRPIKELSKEYIDPEDPDISFLIDLEGGE